MDVDAFWENDLLRANEDLLFTTTLIPPLGMIGGSVKGELYFKQA